MAGFAIFSFFFLAIFPVMMVKDIELTKSIRWPFYVLAFFMALCAIFSIVQTYERSDMGLTPTFSESVLLHTIFSVLTQNTVILVANILPLGSLFSPQARDLSRLAESAAGNELEDQSRGISQTSNRSSFISVKRSTTLIIEGPRSNSDLEAQAGDRPPPPPPKVERSGSAASNFSQRPRYQPTNVARQESTRSTRSQVSTPPRPGTAQSHRTVDSLMRPGTAVSAGGEAERDDIVKKAERGRDSSMGWESFDPESLQRGILRTISVHVVEEAIEGVGREDGAASRLEDEDWKKVLRDGPGGPGR